MDQLDSIELFAHVRAGDERAAEVLYERYLHRLLALANSRLGLNLRRKVDADDIVQSAMGSFYGRAAAGQFDLRRSGDLWRLLAKITLNKLLKKVEYYAAGKRNLTMEQQIAELLDGQAVSPIDNRPAPDELAELSEELELVIREFSPEHRETFFMRLRGESVEAIAEHLQVTERQIRRVLQKVEERLGARLQTVGYLDQTH